MKNTNSKKQLITRTVCATDVKILYLTDDDTIGHATGTVYGNYSDEELPTVVREDWPDMVKVRVIEKYQVKITMTVADFAMCGHVVRVWNDNMEGGAEE